MAPKRILSLLSALLLLSMLVSCAAPAAAPQAPAAQAQPTSAAPVVQAPTVAPAAPAAATTAPEAATTAAPAAAAGNFDWKKYSGTSIKLLLNDHPYEQALVAELPKFTELTGIKVTYDIFPEQNYFDKVTIDLSGGQGGYDAFMTGAYMIWQYAPAKWMEPLEPYINDPVKTNPDYDFNDILPWLAASERWNLEPGAENLGKGSQYALPWAFETNAFMYRYDLFEKDGLKPPTTLDELVAVAKKFKELHPDMAGIMVRGSKNWATIHPGYMTMYASYGCKDYDEKMHPVMNSPCAVEVTNKWIDMVKAAGPQAWTTYTWYQCGSDFGAGKSGILFDADILGYFQNVARWLLDLRQSRVGARSEGPRRQAEHQHLDLVACHERGVQEQGCHLVLPAVGYRQGLPDHRRHQVHDGGPGAPVDLGQSRVQDEDGGIQELLRDVPGDQQGRRADPVHAAAAVLRNDHRVGCDPAGYLRRYRHDARWPEQAGGQAHCHAQAGRYLPTIVGPVRACSPADGG